MKFVYVLANFAILVLLLVLFFRKTLISAFRRHRERTAEEFREIDEAKNYVPPTAESHAPDDGIPGSGASGGDAVSHDEKAKSAQQNKFAQIEAYENREKHALRVKMAGQARKKLFDVMRAAVEDLFSKEPYLSKMRALESSVADDIIAQMKLTPGDGTYLKRFKVLYITLTSAFALEDALVQKVEAAAKKLIAEYDGEISLWVQTEPSLIGGLKLRIGDTVYDGSVAETLYRFERSLSKEAAESGDFADETAKEFFDKARAVSRSIGVYQLGRVISVSDGICWINGLADIMYGEIVEFERGERGMVLDLQRSRIGCVVFGGYENIESGSLVRSVGRIASVRVGEQLLGRVVDALGNPVDGEGALVTSERRPIEFRAPGIVERAPVNAPLFTGIKVVDALIPIGKGQRELIIGDRQTGKSAIAIDAVINQRDKNTVCIYVAIGQKETFIAEMREKLKEHGALANTVIVAAPASGSAALQYITPFSATAMGEYFMYKGRDVLIVYDDLSKHAVAYRELSLLLHRPSGREAYPGDIFYLHSRLLERAAHLSPEHGGGSMTALPIIETLGGDISAYIPTNVISITDGQIFLETELFNEGRRPAVNVGLSVSRVGGAAQTALLKQLSSSLRTQLAQYSELAEFMQFGAEVDEETKKTLKLGRMLTEALKQNRYDPVPTHLQALLLFAVIHGFANDIAPEEMQRFEKKLYAYFESAEKRLSAVLKTGRKPTAETEAELKAALERFKEAEYGGEQAAQQAAKQTSQQTSQQI